MRSGAFLPELDCVGTLVRLLEARNPETRSLLSPV